MSKVKSYMDSNKEKARHRNRIDETRRTKANRVRKCRREAYNWTKGGYYHETEQESYRYEYFDIPETTMKYRTCTGELVVRTIPAHKGRKLVETRIKPVSILRKGLPRRANFFKKTASRTLRRKGRVVNEESYLLNGNTYRKGYEVQWGIW